MDHRHGLRFIRSRHGRWLLALVFASLALSITTIDDDGVVLTLRIVLLTMFVLPGIVGLVRLCRRTIAAARQGWDEGGRRSPVRQNPPLRLGREHECEDTQSPGT